MQHRDDKETIRLNTLWAKAKLHLHSPAHAPRLTSDERKELSQIWKDMGMSESELIELIDPV